MTAPSEQQWFKSSYSGGSGTECVECAYVRDRTLVRDSKCQGDSPIGVRARPGRPSHTLSSEATWRCAEPRLLRPPGDGRGLAGAP